MDQTEPIPPWERQLGETHKQFAHFVTFRDMPPNVRTIRAAYRQATGNSDARQAAGWWSELARTWKWAERARAWDDEQDRQLRTRKLKAVEEMAERHAAVAVLFIKHLVDRLASFNFETLTAGDLQRWFDTAVKVERLSRGEPTSISKDDLKLNASERVVIYLPDNGRDTPPSENGLEVIVRSREEAARILALNGKQGA